MNVTSTRRTGSRKIVEIDGIPADRQVTDDLYVGFAMATVGETPSSLFGWHVCRWTDPTGYRTTAVTVTLHTE